jgi:hypothetical protein
VPDPVDRTGVTQNRVEGREVGMDIRDDRDPHGRPIYQPAAGSGGHDARRERPARSVHGAPRWVRVPSVHAAPLPASASSRTAGAASVFPDPSGSWLSFLVPLADRVTLGSAPVRMPDGKARTCRTSTRFFHQLDGSFELVENPAGQPPRPPLRIGRPRVRRTTSMTSSTYASALPCSAAVRTQPPT